MAIALISSNPLFAEILNLTVLGVAGASVVQLTPESAPEWMREQRPTVIIIDESRLAARELGELLELIRELPDSRTILLNLLNNETTIVSAQRTTIGAMEDLVTVIRNVEEKEEAQAA